MGKEVFVKREAKVEPEERAIQDFLKISFVKFVFVVSILRRIVENI